MNENLTRRNFLSVAGTAALAGSLATTVAHGAQATGKPLRILGIACSPRKGMAPKET